MRTRRTFRQAAPPALCLAVMLVHAMVLVPAPGPSAARRARHAEVQEAVSRLPYRIGRWTGQDIPVPEGTVEILRPNAMLARRYQDVTHDRSLDLLLVHCGDTRDMIGHYPPVCYPAHGWHQVGGRSDLQPLVVGGQRLSARLYRFRRLGELGSEEQMLVLSFFLLPGGESTAELSMLRDMASRYEVSVQGVAQVQLVCSQAMTADLFVQCAQDVLGGASDLLKVIRKG